MQIPETPAKVEQLDLMKRLDAYAKGSATWHDDGSSIGPNAMEACQSLYNGLIRLVNKVFAPILDRIPSHEMETFTMHDRFHGLKVAHLMWYILNPERRERLTPPEIGMMVAAAHLHDLGMALNSEERAARLNPNSDLWDRLEYQEAQKAEIESLRTQSADPNTSESRRSLARLKLVQAEEVLLCQDTRERHAIPERYEEVLSRLTEIHQADHVRIPDIEACFSFDGFSFRDKLIDICGSHNQDSETLVQSDIRNFERPRFPADYPVGCCNADLHLVAAALRLADILDFDRERTPAILFHYLLPGILGDLENRSVLEWSKHLTISNWHIEEDAIVFRGRCNSHIIHHAVVQFCSAIAEEIEATRATFGALQNASWPFILPKTIAADIQEAGYHYIPYKFELDDGRIYELLMGGAIYDNPLVAVRELVQNAVDACKLRDSLTLLYEPYEEPSNKNRITVRYEEPTEQCPQPRLSVIDTGTGMDAFIIERWFLKVGRSYYRSSEFARTRVELRKHNLDFAPVSEFGIGFLSSFLLADRVEVETAMWEPIRGDTHKRILQIDGPTRLMRLDQSRNEGLKRFKGTRITLFLSQEAIRRTTKELPGWKKIQEYLEDVCQDLPYRLNLEHIIDGHVTRSHIDPYPMTLRVPAHLESFTIRIPVNDEEVGLQGEIALVNPLALEKSRSELFAKVSSVIKIKPNIQNNISTRETLDSTLLRGGFKVGRVPGLPGSLDDNCSSAKIRLTWQAQATRRFHVTNLARNAITSENFIGQEITRLWLTYLLDHVEDLPEGQIFTLDINHELNFRKYNWMEHYNALTLYRLAKNGWESTLRYSLKIEDKDVITDWESGIRASLPYVSSGLRPLDKQLLDLILPKITTRILESSGSYYMLSPVSNWQTVLEGWKDYITSPVYWQPLTEFKNRVENSIDKFGREFHNFEHLLYCGYYTINRRFENKLSSFNNDELYSLMNIFSKIFDARNRRDQPRLTKDEALLFSRAVEVVGDLEIASYPGSKTFRVDSFELAREE